MLTLIDTPADIGHAIHTIRLHTPYIRYVGIDMNMAATATPRPFVMAIRFTLTARIRRHAVDIAATLLRHWLPLLPATAIDSQTYASGHYVIEPLRHITSQPRHAPPLRH